MNGLKILNDRLIDIKLTDNTNEKINIGKMLVNTFKEKYSKTTIEQIYGVIDKMEGDSQKKEHRFYVSIYDYWAFGSNINEEYRFDFFNKDSAEKASYITAMWHPIYFGHLNANNKSIVDDKYKLYLFLKDYFKRNVVLLTNKESDFHKFCGFVKTGSSYIVKPQNGYQTVGVYKISINDSTDLRYLYDRIFNDNNAFDSKFNGKIGSSIVIEEWIEQDDRLSSLHPSSVNGVRVTTIKTGNDINVFYPWLKIGVGNAEVTGSEFFGSMDALINPYTGVVYTDGCTKNGERYAVHPTTGVRIKGFQVPRWGELVSLSNELSRRIDELDYIGWDFALTPNGWVVIEGNSNGNFNAQWMLGRGLKDELQNLIKWKPKKRFWWE